MSLSTSGLTAYTDEFLFPLIHKSVVGARTMDFVTVQAGVKSTAEINIMDTAVTFASDACSRTATDSTPLTNRTLTVKAMAIHENICPQDLNGFYTQNLLGAGSLHGEEELPFEQMYWEHKASLISEALDLAIWSGDTTGTGSLWMFDGFLKLIDAASPVDGNVDGVVTATGINKNNIISILWGMYTSLPEQILDKSDLLIYVGIDTFRLYQQAIYEGNLFHYQGESDSLELPLVGTGLKVVALSGLTGTNRIIAGRQSNFIVGTDLAGESEQFKSWYSDDDQILKFTAKFKMGTQVAFPTEIVEFSLV